ncbi:hypothetical protein NDA14_002199 [Ustilago hordei]|nr:hypothetical protein NDA14_002199 [Ustilago hordei]
MEWRLVDTKAPPAMMTEEDFEDLGYNKENIFDETDERPLQEYMDMETDSEERLSRGMAEVMEQGSIAKTQFDSKSFGLIVTQPEWRKNLDPTIHEAMSGEDRKHWEEAMRKELDGLEAMGMWEIVNLPKGANTVDMCWVLKIKTDANLVLTKFKAQLVAQGFTQRKGINYTEVFAPVAPIQSIRGVIAVAAIQDWEIDSIDVKQAYLNSTIHHDVYLKPPVGIKIPPRKALKVVKGLYGLKQSGQEWNIELDSHLQMIGFHCMPSAPCLYSRGTGDKIMIITTYVDDMLITSPSRDEVDCTKREIMDKWETQDNGRIKEFLGIKITHDRKRRKISLGLMAYIKEMVSKWLGGANEKFWVPMCHGPGCSRSRRVTGSYGRSTGIEDLVEISREHGRSAVSMETMDSYGLTCKGGPSTAMRRTKLKEQAQPRRGPSSRSMQMVTTQGLERQEPKELSLIKGGGAVSKESTPGHEEEEQCRRS